MPNSESRSGFPSFGWVLCLIVFVYFLFPHLFLLPYVLVMRSPPSSSSPLSVLFAPVRFLSERFSPYQALLEEETKLTGIH